MWISKLHPKKKTLFSCSSLKKTLTSSVVVGSFLLIPLESHSLVLSIDISSPISLEKEDLRMVTLTVLIHFRIRNSAPTAYSVHDTWPAMDQSYKNPIWRRRQQGKRMMIHHCLFACMSVSVCLSVCPPRVSCVEKKDYIGKSAEFLNFFFHLLEIEGRQGREKKIYRRLVGWLVWWVQSSKQQTDRMIV